ncbi:pilus assembly protein PilM [candidate division KSB1 bacterium]|nr:pilus assembly protein PilM [candidate division KSB1 bacterium]NIR71350.1 pilus assembly protein PilM [candidate division KSB1 bacterium]NIS26240.1 pilus assembly protein PilM [candidate division KSB1 bacterium]NIT74670.1 pilus assembly protein PilM [candidate division KSB1 bacterium]NIU26888.1 pilus assembly protein PilM [candidate division KSB1 bacterium]
MTQMENAGVLGISLIYDQLRIVEGEKHSNEFQITQIANGRVRRPFTFEVFSGKNLARRFAEDITRLCETQGFQVKEAAFSLDSRMVLIKKIPVDQYLNESKIEDQIIWEVRQFAISPVNEYIVDFEQLKSSQDGSAVKHMLVVIVRKRIVEFVKQIFKHTDLQLKVVDVDIFSAQRALQLNYDYNKVGRVGLIEIEEKKVNFSILEGRNYFLSHEVPFPANNTLDNRDDTTTQLISKELRRIILDHQIGRTVEDLSEIYLYGEAVEDGVLEGLQNTYNVRIDRANPFKKVKLVTKLRDQINETRSERFMISVGAAIRGIQ